jgi:hypothetical protein
VLRSRGRERAKRARGAKRAFWPCLPPIDQGESDLLELISLIDQA